MPGVPSSCPKLNFVTAPRAAPKDTANITSRTFLATLLRMLANLRKSPNKSVKLGGLASSVAISDRSRNLRGRAEFSRHSPQRKE